MSEPFGRYSLLKRIAGGGMGEVYLARQSGIQGFEKLLIIKTLLPHLTEDTEFVQMFLDEARIAARLAHPNVVQIFDLGEEQDIYYIAMEYIHGEDVKRIWKQAYHLQEVIPVPLACRIVSDAAAGLGYAHRLADADGQALGLVHRDVSPQNILVTFDGGVKLIDFGVAKAAGRATKTQTGALKGKYAYMSPEQVDGLEIDNRSDIFALGIVLWEMVTGSRLFRADSDVQTLKAVSRCEVVPPSEQNPNVPPALDPIVLKALAKDRDQRYHTAEEFRLDLENWMASTQAQGSAAHLSAFMRHLFTDRLAKEGTKGPLADVDPNATGFSPFGGTSSGRRPRSPSESSSGSKSLVRGELVDRNRQGRAPTPPTGVAIPQQPEAQPGRSWLIPAGAVGGLLITAGLVGLALSNKTPVPPPVAATTAGQAQGDPTPKPVEKARLTLASEPPGAVVRANGRELGPTPLADVLLEPGEVRLELLKPGFKPLIRSEKLDPGANKLAYTLEAAGPQQAVVHLDSEPSGVSVFLGGTFLGTTPFDWKTEAASGPVALTFKKVGFRTEDKDVTRKDGASFKVALAKAAKVTANSSGGKTPAAEPALEIKTGR